MAEHTINGRNCNDLPLVDKLNIHNYLNNIHNKKNIHDKNLKFTEEKTKKYRKSTISSVHIYRKNNICIMKANINLQDKTSSSSCKVEIKTNETRRKIISSKCDDCKTNSGGCKHVTALLFWLLRENESKESHQNTECPIKLEPKINKQYIECKDFAIKKINKVSHTGSFLDQIKNNPSSKHCKSPLIKNLLQNKLPSLNLYILAEIYKSQSGNVENSEEFINFCKEHFDAGSIQKFAHSTKAQANNTEWHEMRYGRITASKLYAAASCKYSNEYLLKVIMGDMKFRTNEIDKGQKLEEKVLKVVKEKYNIKISRVGLYLNKDYPIFGASPDGISSDFCIEVKCPLSKNSLKNYIDFNNKIHIKHMAQLQLQMFLCNKSKGLFCLADPNFVQNNKVNIFEVDLDEIFLQDMMDKAQKFWEKSIFPILMQN